MDRVLGVFLLCVFCVLLGAAGTYGYLLIDANTQWRTLTDDIRAKTAEVLVVERRLAAAKTKRAQESAVLEEKVNASDLDKCPTPADVVVLLSDAAETTRSRPSTGLPARRVP